MIERVADFLLGSVARVRHGGVIVNEHALDAKEMRRHVEALHSHFDFIHHDDLIDRLQRPRRRPFCLLTFDDGKRSNASIVAPVLTEMGIPAVFYVCTEPLSVGRPLWFDEWRALLRKADEVPAGLELADVLSQPYDVTRECLDAAKKSYGTCVDLEDDDIRPMSWDDARDLDDAGFTIGAHGVRHAILTHLSMDAAEWEIKQSIADVSREMGAPCSTFAFPNGNYTPALAQCALDAGVETVMTTEPKWAEKRTPHWRLPRVQLTRTHSRAKVATKLAVAAIGRVLKNPDGSGRAYVRRGSDAWTAAGA